MPIPDSVDGCVAIPCGHCGQALQLSLVHLMPILGIQCLDCGQPVLLHLSGLAEDMKAASRILASFRRRVADG